MRRRDFIILGSAAAAPLLASPRAAHAQQPQRTRRIAALMTLTSDDQEGQARLKELRKGLETHGWSEGRNIQLDVRWAGADTKRLQVDAAELIKLKPEVVVAGGSRALIALQELTKETPIVFVAAAGSIEHGLVTNVARPSGNLTGFTTFDTFALAGKLMGLLKEVAPRMSRVLLIMYKDHPSLSGYQQRLLADAPSLGVQTSVAGAADAAELERIIAEFAREPNGGLLLPADQFNILHRELIVALAARHRLPSIYAYRSHAAAGGLISYGVDFTALYGFAAAYVDRILKGEKLSDLPVQSPTKYEMAINHKTAKTLGLEIPPRLLFTAEEVFE